MSLQKDDHGSWDWWEERSLGQKIAVGVGFGLLGLGLLALYPFLVMSLWNWLMPELFGLKPLDYWQALGLPTLIMLLFLGVGGGDKSQSRDRKRKRHLRRYLQTEEAPRGPVEPS